MWTSWARTFLGGAARHVSDRHFTLTGKDRVVYAIGDVHGCLDQLLQLESLIVEDARRYSDREKTIIVLGDFIDRGPRTAQVVAHLVAPPPSGFARIAIAGNHERAMLTFLDQPAAMRNWLATGGLETLASYGVRGHVGVITRGESRRLAREASASIPDEHLQFLRNLPTSVAWGRYLFVHACQTAPGREAEPPTASQPVTPTDHCAVVVHGHALTPEPEDCGDRIGVDIGAYVYGRLACVRLDGETVRFLVATETGRSLSRFVEG
jgi:serine/threonine protein phosphatase 1